jgi:hypothetical protein
MSDLCDAVYRFMTRWDRRALVCDRDTGHVGQHECQDETGTVYLWQD